MVSVMLIRWTRGEDDLWVPAVRPLVVCVASDKAGCVYDALHMQPYLNVLNKFLPRDADNRGNQFLSQGV